MGENSSISWTDHTFNPWIGCTKVSPGCANCYAEAYDKRWGGEHWGKGAPRQRTSEANWRKPLKWNREASGPLQSFQEVRTVDGRTFRGTIEQMAALNLAMDDVIYAGPARPRVFCASLADWLDDEVPIEWLADLLALIHATPNLDWLLLTKRPQIWKRRMIAACDSLRIETTPLDAQRFIVDWRDGKSPANVWIGTTVEDQQRADERIPALLQIPAKVRFLSCEPLLGPVDLAKSRALPVFRYADTVLQVDGLTGRTFGVLTNQQSLNGGWRRHDGNRQPWIDWVICGGESGPNARPMHPDWARSLRDQCAAAGTPFSFKQWGEWAPFTTKDEWPEKAPLNCMKKNGEFSWWAGNEDTAINWSRNYDESDQPIERLGKKAAGHLLDGREHNAFPDAATTTIP
jgi:protein gp37